jgi:vanillate O-demethylase monooxygenase subunit
MGDADKANPDDIPDFTDTAPREGVKHVYGYFTLDVNYELVVDNLLDRTHVQYMHADISPGFELPENFEKIQKVEQDGDIVWDYHYELNSPLVPMLRPLWPDAPDLVEAYLDMRWQAPSTLLQISGSSVMGSERKDGLHMPACHFITPADENETHYFWAVTRSVLIDNDMVSQKIYEGVSHAFIDEDGEMLKEVVKMMGTNDLMSLNPLLLKTDEAAVRARRQLTKRINEEQAETV